MLSPTRSPVSLLTLDAKAVLTMFCDVNDKQKIICLLTFRFSALSASHAAAWQCIYARLKIFTDCLFVVSYVSWNAPVIQKWSKSIYNSKTVHATEPILVSRGHSTLKI